jgi:hypothetical protein
MGVRRFVRVWRNLQDFRCLGGGVRNGEEEG